MSNQVSSGFVDCQPNILDLIHGQIGPGGDGCCNAPGYRHVGGISGKGNFNCCRRTG
jgi:hypothetical protein